jgi:hypothetical protein
MNEVIREYLAQKFPPEYGDGFSVGLGEKSEGPREPGDYPKGLHKWPLERRNAWFAGVNIGPRAPRQASSGGRQ